ncbi:ligase [Chlorella sorokiniana]|uniref:Ligase n=1 Tax=Chlorella sorokiniana TaxID=3076 RepID=A0A2P6TEG6_CHLSO|nr:ligase [Chlorella sorokiniana]|eukprot:PRW21027.1 ligase [Chlorella sorokiniana]
MATDWSDVLRPSVQYVRLLFCDASGMRRCRVIPRSKLEAVSQQGLGYAWASFWLPAWGDCCISDPAASPVGEMRLVPDMAATRTLPWMPSHATSLATLSYAPGQPWEFCPRSALQRVLAQAQEQHGLTVQLGYELEFYLLHKPDRQQLLDKHAAMAAEAALGRPPGGSIARPPVLPLPFDSHNYSGAGGFEGAATVLSEMCATLTALGSKVDQLHCESGPGQFELALSHAPALQAADGLLFALEAVSAVAAKHELVASFLPKLFNGEAASGRHCHFSVWRGDTNLFAHEAAPAPAAAGAAAPPPGEGEAAVRGLDPDGEAFLAGVLRHLPALMVFTTPAPNSYRRLAPHCWSGAYQCFGPQNREAPLRLCSTPGNPAAANCELKTSDGTANPHLAAAALIVAGLLGVRQQLRLPPACALDPGTLTEEQRAAAGIARLPASLAEATAAFEADAGAAACPSWAALLPPTMEGQQQHPPLDSNAAAATAAAPALPQLPPAPGLMLQPAAQLHVPWTLDQFVWDPSALTAASGGPPPPLPPLPPAVGGGDENTGRTSDGASASGPASAAAAAAGAAPSAASVHADQAGSALAAALAVGQPLPEWPESPPPPPSPPPGGKPAFCQVCHEGVSGLKDYYARYKICPAHCVMPGIVKDGRVLRFCQQCGRFQPIEDFDESKRTCRRKLERHNSRRRNLTKVRAAGGGSATTSTRTTSAVTARKPKPKRAWAATPGPVSDAPPEQLLKQEQQQEQPAEQQQQQQQQQPAGQPLPPEVARALGLPVAGGDSGEAAAAAAAAGPAAAAPAEAAAGEGEAQQAVPMELDELLSALNVQPQTQQGSPAAAAPLVLPSPVAGAGGLLGLEASPMLASPVLPGLSGSPGSAGGGKRLRPPPTVPAGVAAQLQQRQPAAAGAAPGRAVAGTEFDSLIADLLGSGPPNASNAWLADVLLAPSDTAQPGGTAPPIILPSALAPQQQQQPQQGVLPALSGFPLPSLMPADDSLATTAASGGASQAPGAAVKAEPAFEVPGPTVAMPALPPFPVQDLDISGLQAAPLQMQPPPLGAPTAPAQQLVPQLFGAAAPPLQLPPLPSQFGGSVPQGPLPPPASLEQALAIMGQQPTAMIPLFQPPDMQPPHVQLSLKLFGVTPEALPPELRSELQSLLGSPMLEGYLRPGCTHLTLEALLQDEQQLAALHRMGVAGAVQHLLQTTTGLGCLLRRAPVLVQLGDELAVVAEGKVQRVLKLSACEGVLPRISSIRPLVLRASSSSGAIDKCPDAANPEDAACQQAIAGQQSSSGERILVRGSTLLGEHCRLLVRSGGTYPLVEILATSGPLGAPRRAMTTAGTAGGSSVFAQEDEWLEIRLPEVQEGLYTVEAQRGGLLGCSCTLLALQDERAVAELRQLEVNCAGFTDVDAFLRSIALVLRHRQLLAAQAGGDEQDSSFADDSSAAEAADGGLDSDGTGDAAAPLAQLAARAARAGVAAAASRGWPSVAALLLPSITADGSPAADAVRAINALCQPGSPLLFLATASRSVPLLQVLTGWGHQQGYTWAIAAPAGPSALTPLHLAAAARDGPLVKALFEMDPASARSAWLAAKTSDGLTPAAFAALAKQRQAAAAAGAAAKPAAVAAPLPAAASSVAAAAAPAAASASSAGQQSNGHLLPSSAPLAAATIPLLIKPAEPPSPGRPKSPNGVAVSEAEHSVSSISSGASYSQLAALATGLSGRLGSGTFVLSPTAALAPAPSLPATFVDASGEVRSCSGEARTLSPPTPEVSPRLSGEAPAAAAPAAEGGCKALVVAAPTTAATLAVRAGPAVVGRSASGDAEESGASSPTSSGSRSDEDSSQASESGSPLRMSESPVLLKPGSPAGPEAEPDGDSLVPEEEALERVSSGSAKARLSCRWGEAEAVAAVECDCCSCGGWEGPAKGLGSAANRTIVPCWVDRVLADHESGCADVLDAVRSRLGAEGQAEVEALIADLSRDDAAGAAALVAAAVDGVLLAFGDRPDLEEEFQKGQLMILMLHTRLNPLHCNRHPHMLAAVHAVHTRLVRPALRAAALLLGHGGGNAALSDATATQQLCATYLPVMQLGLGLLLPCCLVYRHERALRRRFLAARRMRMDPLFVRRELGTALLAVAIQLAALVTLEYGR